VGCQNKRFVPIKTDDQFDLQALHRVRDRLMIRRTSVINQLRAFLLERGLVFAIEEPVRGSFELPGFSTSDRRVAYRRTESLTGRVN
jgi:transposase